MLIETNVILFLTALLALIATSGQDNIYVVARDDDKAAHRVARVVWSVPLQLLAYHVAKARGLNVDKLRNLAKSVTVE